MTTLAGNPGSVGSADGTGGLARFNTPRGVATDGTNVYVADTNNHTIRQIVIATGVVTTLAGTVGLAGSMDGTGTAARFDNPSDVDTDGTNVFVADRANGMIRKIVLSSGVVTTPIGIAGTARVDLGVLPARLNVPNGVAVSLGELFIVEPPENSILRSPIP